jgi:hypothetical protein
LGDKSLGCPIEVAHAELRGKPVFVPQTSTTSATFIAYGMSSQGFHIFRATKLTQGEANPENEEQDLVGKRVPSRSSNK